MKESLLSKLIVLITKYIKILNFVLGIFAGIFIINKYGWNFILNWKIEYNQIFIDYLKILLNYPSAILIVLIVLFTKFNSSIDYFIRNLVIKIKDTQISTQQTNNFPIETQTPKAVDEAVVLSKQDAQEIAGNIERLQNDNITQKKQIEELQGYVLQLANRSEYFEFQYLNYFLVFNTKLNLKDLYLKGVITKGLFIQNIFIPSTVVDKIAEKLAIHNALLTNGLIDDDQSTVKVSDKGLRYLKSINLV